MTASKFTAKDRRNLVKIGQELCVLTQEDADFILDEKNTEEACRRRLKGAIMRDSR